MQRRTDLVHLSTDIIAITVSTISLIVAFLALYFTVLRKGKIKLKIYKNEGDMNLDNGGTVERDICTSFSVTFPVVIENTGINPKAIQQMKFIVDVPEFMSVNIFNVPSFADINGLRVLKPYEQDIGYLQINFQIEGYGKGHTKEYMDLLESIPDIIADERYEIKVITKVCGKRKIIEQEQTFNIKTLMVKKLLKQVRS